MPALNFKYRFAVAVRDGRKLQTIRAPRKNPIRAGDTLYLYTGMRTSACKILGTARCSSAHEIKISLDGYTLDGLKHVDKSKLDEFAQADGFDDWKDLVWFFVANHLLEKPATLIRWQFIIRS